MRDFLADLLARLRATDRQQRLYLALAAALLLVAGRYGIGWFLEYRHDVKEGIQLSAQRLANARRLLERAPQESARLAEIEQRYQQALATLIPGDTPTLAAARLQDRVSDLAQQANVQIQTTQVLKDEPVGPFRQVSLRVTASAELRALAEFLAELEFGDPRVTIPFLELSRRGIPMRRTGDPAQQVRSVQATLQINGIMRGSADGPAGDTPPAAAAEDGAPPSPMPPTAASLPLPEPDRPVIPEDPLGTAQQGTPP